jgi:hypothetical protein
VLSRKTIHWILFGVCLLALPVPFLSLESGTAPPLRLLFIGSLVLGVAVQDPDLMSGLLTLIYFGQGLLWSIGLYYGTRFAAERLAGSRVRSLAAAVFAVLLITASFFPIYRTPFSSSALHSNILGIFD